MPNILLSNAAFRLPPSYRFLSSFQKRYSTQIDSALAGQIVVVGGGAVGSLFAGRLGSLKKLKGRVWMLSSWEEHTSMIKKLPGLIVQEQGSIGNSCLIGNVRCAGSSKEILTTLAAERGMGASTSISAVLIAVKQSGVRKAAQQAGELLAKGHGGLCLALLNGMGHMEIIADAIRCAQCPYSRRALTRAQRRRRRRRRRVAKLASLR